MVRPGAEQIFDYVHEERNQFLHLRLERMLMEKIIGLFVSIIEQGNREKVWVVEYPLETMKILVIGLQQYLYGVDRLSEEYGEKVRRGLNIVEKTFGIIKGSIKIF